MPRGLDHIVHAVRDLDAAGEFYQRAGFVVGARNRHPWGTHNRIVQLPGFFIELLTVAEPDKLSDDGIALLFGRFNRDFLAQGEGLSMLMLASADARQDAGMFRNAGIAASEALRFERQGRRPDGSVVTVAFSLAFARDKKSTRAGFAACQHHFPDHFWNPAFQKHANTADRVAGVVMAAERPSDHHLFLADFVGQREIKPTAAGLLLATPRGDVQLMSRATFAKEFGVTAPDVSTGLRCAALRIAVRNLSATNDVLAEAGIPAAFRAGRLVVGPRLAFGATLVFEQAG